MVDQYFPDNVLFEREEEILKEGLKLVDNLKDQGNPLFPHFERLLHEFSRMVAQMQRLIRIGDSMQQKLNDLAAALQVEVDHRREADRVKEGVIEELKAAMAQVKQLSGLLPICASCKKIRDDQGYWQQIESYIRDHSDAKFTHSLCPGCAKKLYPDFS
jgi:hypothetical protein